MRARTLALLWLVLGGLIWCGLFDGAIAKGADDYLRRQAEFELHLIRDAPSMPRMMAAAERHGAAVASAWGGLVVAFGWFTIWLRGGTRTRSSRGSL